MSIKVKSQEKRFLMLTTSPLRAVPGNLQSFAIIDQAIALAQGEVILIHFALNFFAISYTR